MAILTERWGITALNPMQQAVIAQEATTDLVIYSPTGSGKTLAFAIPLVEALASNGVGVQAVVIAPSRELALQTHDTLRSLAVGHKVTCLYGGHRASEERQSLTVEPAVIVATPGRLLDHVQHARVDLYRVTTLVLDEFDKCLELGFEDEMRQLLQHIPQQARRMLTSATRLDAIPAYVGMRHVVTLDFLSHATAPSMRMTVHAVHSPERDKLATLRQLLLTIEPARIIVFVGFRDSVARVADYLQKNKISTGIYHGALNQNDREVALAMFRNHSVSVLVTTDLAARGLDIDGVRHIIHYHLSTTAEAWTHRNGRTARVDTHGDVYVLTGPDEALPEFITPDDEMPLSADTPRNSLPAPMATLHIKAGKKEKISRGDIAGFIARNCGDLMQANDIGRIEVKDHYSMVAVPRHLSHEIATRLSRLPIKGHRARITLMH